MKSLSIKQAKAPKSNKALTLMLQDLYLIISEIVKYEEGSEDRIGPVD